MRSILITTLCSLFFMATIPTAFAKDSYYNGPYREISDNEYKNIMQDLMHCSYEKGGTFTKHKVYRVMLSLKSNRSEVVYEEGKSRIADPFRYDDEVIWKDDLGSCEMLGNGDISCEGGKLGRFLVSFESKRLGMRTCGTLESIGGCMPAMLLFVKASALDKKIDMDCTIGDTGLEMP